MNLPEPCEKCRPLGGNWQETERGLKRCNCSRGVALAEAAKPKAYRPPVISPAHATMCAEMMSDIPYYPANSGARATIASEIAAMCSSPEQAAWLAMRMVRLYAKWPGTKEMRIVFCSSELPLDGIAAIGTSEVYPDGIPSEREPQPLALPAPPRNQLAIGGTVSAAASVQSTVAALVVRKDLNRVIEKRHAPAVPEIPVTRQVLTAADIEREVAEMRERKAREAITA